MTIASNLSAQADEIVEFLNNPYSKCKAYKYTNYEYNSKKNQITHDKIRILPNKYNLKDIKILECPGECPITDEEKENYKRIENIPSSICLLDQLVSFRFSNSDIKSLPTCIENFTNMEELILDNNKIISLPNIEKLSKLHYIDLSFNKVNLLPDLTKMSKLSYLNLTLNKITDIRPLLKFILQRYNDLSQKPYLQNPKDIYISLCANPLMPEAENILNKLDLHWTCTSGPSISEPIYDIITLDMKI